MSGPRARLGDEHLGEGWSFPVRWTLPEPGAGGGPPPKGQGGVRLSRGRRDIEEAIRIILGTALGSRVMRPEFGADVARYVFAERRAETCFRLRADVERALLLWEPRVVVERVEAVPSPEHEAQIDVRVAYRVDRHRRPESLVFPFYLDARVDAPPTAGAEPGRGATA